MSLPSNSHGLLTLVTVTYQNLDRHPNILIQIDTNKDLTICRYAKCHNSEHKTIRFVLLATCNLTFHVTELQSVDLTQLRVARKLLQKDITLLTAAHKMLKISKHFESHFIPVSGFAKIVRFQRRVVSVAWQVSCTCVLYKYTRRTVKQY